MELESFVYVIAAFSGYIVAQTIKFILELRQDGFSLEDLFESGGMPSSHTSFVSSVVTVIGLIEGFESAIFGLGLTLLGVVLYDAIGVRRATGENTKTLRNITKQLKLGNTDRALTLVKGHTPIQVAAGLATGILTGLTVYSLVI